jgi:RNA polymerase sigma-70 factor (ECF subfamily)
MNAKMQPGVAVVATHLSQPYVADVSSYEAMYRAEYPLLVAIAKAFTGDVQASEDLVQDTMVKAYLRWHWLVSLGRPGAWCNRVLTNACKSWWTRRRLEQRHARSLGGPTTTEHEAWTAEFMDFWSAVRRLPARQRTTVTLFYAGGYTCADMADILNVPEGTVRSDLSRSRVWLARELGYLS